mgnify:CR=1 FL=1
MTAPEVRNLDELGGDGRMASMRPGHDCPGSASGISVFAPIVQSAASMRPGHDCPGSKRLAQLIETASARALQ